MTGGIVFLEIEIPASTPKRNRLATNTCSAPFLLHPLLSSPSSVSAPASAAAPAGAMDLFPDRAHVRLRSRVRGGYLHADEDGVSVSLRARRASLNTAWQVHRVPRDDGVTYVLLHSAAYGWTPGQEDVLWVAMRYGDHVRLRHVSYSLLRANGRYRRWLNGVSVDNDASNQSTMTHWRVEAIPPRAQPPALPLPTPVSSLFPSLSLELLCSRRFGAGESTDVAIL
ncbi:hypothetical protein HU200_035667 [Digitaria exilis]|uniref:DUF569 domain-containing protein n=1 Tax=Digitaria exilis TaxID=1010633 RepID=A0A835BIY5_9POAL|nr:hypothetical protein HU200_035667 [Digitaria exilis]